MDLERGVGSKALRENCRAGPKKAARGSRKNLVHAAMASHRYSRGFRLPRAGYVLPQRPVGRIEATEIPAQTRSLRELCR
jgi:hypothetical protein